MYANGATQIATAMQIPATVNTFLMIVLSVEMLRNVNGTSARVIGPSEPTNRGSSRCPLRPGSITMTPLTCGRSSGPRRRSRMARSSFTAGFAGLRRGEVLALRWRDIDFEASTIRVEHSVGADGELKSPKSGYSRAVPMVPELGAELDRLSARDVRRPRRLRVRRREGPAARRVGCAPPVYGRAEEGRAMSYSLPRPPPLVRDHRANAALTGHELQAWMGHADYRTTTRYLHYRTRGDEAARLATAFAPQAELQRDRDHVLPAEGVVACHLVTPTTTDAAVPWTSWRRKARRQGRAFLVGVVAAGNAVMHRCRSADRCDDRAGACVARVWVVARVRLDDHDVSGVAGDLRA